MREADASDTGFSILVFLLISISVHTLDIARTQLSHDIWHKVKKNVILNAQITDIVDMNYRANGTKSPPKINDYCPVTPSNQARSSVFTGLFHWHHVLGLLLNLTLFLQMSSTCFLVYYSSSRCLVFVLPCALSNSKLLFVHILFYYSALTFLVLSIFLKSKYKEGCMFIKFNYLLQIEIKQEAETGSNAYQSAGSYSLSKQSCTMLPQLWILTICLLGDTWEGSQS